MTDADCSCSFKYGWNPWHNWSFFLIFGRLTMTDVTTLVKNRLSDLQNRHLFIVDKLAHTTITVAESRNFCSSLRHGHTSVKAHEWDTRVAVFFCYKMPKTHDYRPRRIAGCLICINITLLIYHRVLSWWNKSHMQNSASSDFEVEALIPLNFSLASLCSRTFPAYQTISGCICEQS